MPVIGATRGPRDIARPAFPRVDTGNRGSQSTPFAVGDSGDLPPIGNRKSNADAPDATEKALTKADLPATAPASPSAQDMAVASSASRMEAEAQREIAQLREGERQQKPDATAAVARAEEAHSGAEAQPASHDPDGTINVLIRERAQTLGGRGHTHADSGCGFCRGAARAYG